MKNINQRLFSIFILLFATASAYAQTPHAQLQQMVEQLQKTPADNALREKIIKLALALKQTPALPPEAERRMARGAAAFKGATATTDYQDAAREFEQATLAAPWYGDAYFNLGVVQDKAGNFEGALRSLNYARLAAPDSKEIKALIYEVEYRMEKANSPAARAAREKEAAQRFIASLEGAKYVCPEFRNDRDASRVEIDIKNGNIAGANIITWINPRLTPGVDYASNAFVGFRGMWWGGGEMPLQGSVSVKRTESEEMRVELDDNRLTFVQQITFSGDSAPTVYPSQACLRVR